MNKTLRHYTIVFIKIRDMCVDFYTLERRECRAQSARREMRMTDAHKESTKALAALCRERQRLYIVYPLNIGAGELGVALNGSRPIDRVLITV